MDTYWKSGRFSWEMGVFGGYGEGAEVLERWK
jgi:hypothetical protein